MSLQVGRGHTYFVELDQNPSFGSAGSVIPALLTSGEIFAFHRNAFLTGRERFAALGLLDIPFDLAKLTDVQQRQLTGAPPQGPRPHFGFNQWVVLGKTK